MSRTWNEGPESRQDDVAAFLAMQLGVPRESLAADDEEVTADLVSRTVTETLLQSSLVRREYADHLVAEARAATVHATAGERFSCVA
ncbi:hypothetical protein [Rathayibacter toxicus]|uniref:hypothetical protein n=1 Tax=Rathayibacter toxicus TaxID=145458 RepID=UPI000CE7825C|nr:hypothetical protein [Rathayibacter toxicus]PPI55361.1 hypothetical protein C5D35_06610 [Rathayibacter toxicus]QOD11306.1 hypothetical protein BSG36_05045 [Rathayibacter toxicus]QWL28049.1 hypothetical protein E2R33_05055 [Rathayibacter toxicus]